jgi:hypothetical protein
MEYRVRLHLTTAAIVLALGFAVSIVTSTVVVARAYEARGEQATHREQTIAVKGSTRQRVRSDRAVWSIRVRAEGKALPEAFAVLESGVQRVRRFLAENNFVDTEIGLAAVTTEEQRTRDKEGHETPEVVGYALERIFWITTGSITTRSCPN